MRYGIGPSLILVHLSTSSAFHFAPLGRSNLARQRSVLQQVTVYTAGEGNTSGNATTSTLYLAGLVTDAVQTDDDEEEIELAERRRRYTERFGTYRVTLPLNEESSAVAPSAPMGMSICQFSAGPAISSRVFDFDTFRIASLQDVDAEVSEDDAVESISISVMNQRLDRNSAGLYVSSVIKSSPAWNAGIRPGDLLTASAATLGATLWPKTTLEGVRTALTSRRMITGSATFEFQRTDLDKADNVYELTLSKPIGLNLRDTEDGCVEVVGFTINAPTLVRQAVRMGDKVIAVDSSLGDQMWPVSKMEGVISACTSRLPGQQVTLRFERPVANLGVEAQAVMEPPLMAAVTVEETQQAATPTVTKEDEKELLKRCRDTLRRYASDEQILSGSKPAKFVSKFDVPAMVADRVLEALAKAKASLDSITLSMTMDAYLSCGKANGAIRAFEAAVGMNGDGSIFPIAVNAENDITGIQANPAALNLYTISSLLRAHAIKRDLRSVRRVVAAMEGRGGENVSGLETAFWPGTGGAGVIVPDTQCYNVAISAAAKAGTSEGLLLALKLFEGLKDPSVIFGVDTSHPGKPEKNAVTFNSIISALTMAGKFDEAFSAFFTMKRVGLKANKYTYTSLLKACVDDGDLQELLYDMKEHGVQEDVAMYNARIRSLCDEGKLAQARTLITQMESKDVNPDSRTYGILMKGLLRAGKPGACLALFEAARNNERTSQITENVYLYTTAVTAASQLGDHDRALDLVSRMSADGVKPNTKTLTALMGACLANERADLAAEVYKKIVKPDGYAVSQGLDALCRSGDLSSAAALLSDQKRGSRTLSGKQLMQGYEMIIATSVRYGDFDMARSMFAELLAKSYIPSKRTLHTLIGAMGFIEKGKLVLEYVHRDPEQHEFLLFIIDAMQQRRLAVDGFLYAATIACGNQLGGRHKDVGQMLVKSKALFDEMGGKVVKLEDGAPSEPLFVRWEEVLSDATSLSRLKSSPALLPSLEVQMSKQHSRIVFFAEKFMSRPNPVEELQATAQ